MRQFLVSALALLITIQYYHLNNESQTDFEKWATKHQKFFSGSEKIFRMEIYNQNKKMIEEHNQREDSSYQMGENKFMVLSSEEFLYLYNQQIGEFFEVKKNDTIPEIKKDILAAVDWRNYSKVKDQGTCNSGYAFSVSNQIEAWFAISKKQYGIMPSVQQIVSCSSLNAGCAGGQNNFAFQYVKEAGLVSTFDFPYDPYFAMCNIPKKPYIFIDDFEWVGLEEKYVKFYLNSQPISTSVNVEKWQFYKSGIFSDCISTRQNHYVLIVGYDSNNNWIIQNSWGEGWGENGHIRLSPGNTCGLIQQTYQIV
ncbi:unnamed protein product [Paramecium sonneborni]|uniref:Papain family cysteine protease n=1 Tax=Paramecium sonneborni TaxID=65129 RepID=A0A8S1QT01_9CILI|nr:unnamed protein product [Paramecium sonneborni]